MRVMRVIGAGAESHMGYWSGGRESCGLLDQPQHFGWQLQMDNSMLRML